MTLLLRSGRTRWHLVFQRVGLFLRDFARSPRSVPISLRYLDQGAQGAIHGFLIGEMHGNVRREEHEIGPCPIAREIFAANSTTQFGQVIFGPEIVAPF